MSLHEVAIAPATRPWDYLGCASAFTCTSGACQNPGETAHYECFGDNDADVWSCECSSCNAARLGYLYVRPGGTGVQYGEDEAGVCTMCADRGHHMAFMLHELRTASRTPPTTRRRPFPWNDGTH